MKNIVVLTSMIFFVIATSFAIPRNNNVSEISNSSKVAYTINLPGKVVDGKSYPAQSIDIERLSAEHVYHNIIEIKTKVYQNFDEKSARFDNKILQAELENINSIGIRTPYAGFFAGNQLLSADKFGVSRIYEIRYEGNHDPYDICKILLNNPEIEYATPVFKRYQYAYDPDDSWYSIQYHHQRMKMPDAWDITKGDTNIVIAIVDSGTDIDHEDLKANIWKNPNEIPNNGKDDDGNGKIDDINGWDMIGNISVAQMQNGQYQENNNPTSKLNTHGTHTAGCASAVSNNAKGVAAPGFNTRLMPVKCASDAFESPGISRGYEGILYAAVTGANIINCSWGGPGISLSELDVVNQAQSLGALIVAAAGNSGSNLDLNPEYPAAFAGVMSVGSSGSTDGASNFTCYGNVVRVFAPGENIWSTLPNNKYEAQSGTSMASPVAAGVAALVLSIHPDWTPAQVIYQLRGTSDDVLQPTAPTARPLFFGRINAARALQFNNLPGQNMPGIGLESISAGPNNAITNYEFNPITITLKNYLSADDKVKIKITPLDNFLDFEESVFEIGNFDAMEVKDITLNAKLLLNNPWFKGDAEVLIEVSGTNYMNLEVAKIKINIPSNNRFTSYSEFPSQYGITWHGSSLVNNDLIYMVGSSPVIGGLAIKSNGYTRSMIQVDEQPVYSIYAFDENNIIVGDGPTSGVASIFSSNNSGQSWTKKSVAHITTFTNSFNFYNKFQGLLLGDPRGTTWGIGYTNDAGNTWQLVSNVPPAIANETGLVGSVFQIKDTVWFGTTAGRIFKTNDRGVTWSVMNVFTGGYVTSLSFNENIGVCLYAQSSADNAPRFLATTKNGGLTWNTSAYNFTANLQVPLNVYAIKESNSIVVQQYNGQLIASDNEGASWYPVLSEKSGSYMYATANQVGDKVSIFNGGYSEISRLDFNFNPSVIRKELAFVSGNSLEFGSLEVNTNLDLIKEIRNSGNSDVTVNSITFVPDEGTDASEFRVLIPLPQQISASQPSTLRIRFQPKSIGSKSGKVVIKSDAENNEIYLQVTGSSTNPSSVLVSSDEKLFTIYPNPATSKIRITLNDNISLSEFVIYDVDGNEVVKSNSILADIDISKLSSGNYFVKLISKDKVLNGQFVITR